MYAMSNWDLLNKQCKVFIMFNSLWFVFFDIPELYCNNSSCFVHNTSKMFVISLLPSLFPFLPLICCKYLKNILISIKPGS